MRATSYKPTWSAVATCVAGLVWPTVSTATLDIPDMPLFLTSTGVTPNIVLTLDDSGSMSRAFTPDLCGNPDGICNNNPDASLNPRYVKSSYYNPLYYNPAFSYTIPPNANGNAVSAPTFQAAYINGFEPARGTVNLATEYRPSAGLYLSKPGESGVYWQYMNHYANDPVKPTTSWTTQNSSGTMQGSNSGSNAPYFVITGFVNADGSASGDDPGTNIVSVTVNGTASSNVGTFTGSCNNSQDPSNNYEYKTQISGGTLTLCFRDSNTMYGKQVVVTHRTGSGSTTYGAVGATENAAAYYYVFDSSNANCNGTATDNDCYDVKIVSATSGPGGTDERQNFANWYSFYRTRNLMTVSATARAFSTLPETTRVAWQSLNSCRGSTSDLVTSDCEGWEVTNPNFSNAIAPFTGTQKSDFYTWLFRLKTRTSTPLPDAMERAGDYYSASGADSPYDNVIDDSTNNEEYSCRKNFHVMMTDGVWNTAVSGYGNYDSTTHGLPDGTTYNSRRPYQDSNSNSLADVAFKYWATDLRTDLDNSVPSYVTDFSGLTSDQYFNPKNDPSSWQHMVNFTVGLGLTPFLASSGLTWGGNTYAGSYPAIVAGTKTWPAANSSGVDGNVADLWHAAINSRGKFYSADNPAALVSAFQEITDTISTIAASGGGAGLSSNTTQIDQEGALIFEAKFNADWSGRLLGRPVQTDGSLGTEYWDAGQLIPAPHARNILTTNSGAEEFTTCSTPLQDALDKDANGVNDGLCSQRLNWLRGDGKVTGATWASFDAATNAATATFSVTEHGFVVGDKVTISDVVVSEDPAPANGYNGAFVVTGTTTDTFTASVPSTATGLGTYNKGGRARYTDFRNRQTSVLGDIMNSDPVYAYQDDFGYGGGASTVLGKGTYPAFVASKDSQPPVIYVGANDGMLHGFQADTAAPNSGVELLAYVPHGVYGNLSQLTDPGYTHKYFVDGPTSIGDAYIGGSWGTYLLGSLGAGGKSVFALDVSDPTNFTAADVKWEFSDASDLGLTYSKPQSAAITASQWAAIFGNGYGSTNGQAYLYVVDLSNGNEIAKLATNSDVDNGLSTPFLYDSNGDKVVDVVYAGDLQGNLWKFVNTGGTWTLGNGGDPLFTAHLASGDVQPITSQPKVATHPLGGVLIYFGTGSYLTYGDINEPDSPGAQAFDGTQAFYAIWDSGTSGTVARSELQGHSILTETTAFGHTVRTTSDESVDWGTQRGCYLDLPTTTGVPSERIVSTSLILEFVDPTVPDRVLFVTNTPAQDPCSRGGTTWLMELDLVTCGRTATSVFDLNGNGSFDTGDTVGGVPVSGVALPPSYGITGEPLLLKASNGNIIKEFSGSTGVSGTAGGPLQQGEPPAVAGTPTRLYWKQIQ